MKHKKRMLEKQLMLWLSYVKEQAEGCLVPLSD